MNFGRPAFARNQHSRETAMSLPTQHVTPAATTFTPTLGALAVGTLTESAHPQVIEITQRIFGGVISIEKEPDPEIDDEYFVVTAPAAGTPDQIAANMGVWLREIRKAIGDRINDYRLMPDTR